MRALHDWFFQNKRDFPWRIDPTPYKVWVSEVMLQQTRASVVVDYFERWMQQFPDIYALAAASLEQVIKAWEGLGYYSRARNLHEGAKQIVEVFGGKIPDNKEQLAEIRGLGPYTIGAILSFGFRQRAAALDGNVIRVLARYFGIEECVDRQPVKRRLSERAEAFLDEEAPWVTMEALIELGATVCAPKSRCEQCPLSAGCVARREGKVAALPIKKEAPVVTTLRRAVVVIESCGAVLLKREEEKKVMQGLYELPYFEMHRERWGLSRVREEVEHKLGLKVEVLGKLPEVVHTFTRYKAHLFPLHMKVELPTQIPGYEWVPISGLAALPFSSGHRKIIALFWKES